MQTPDIPLAPSLFDLLRLGEGIESAGYYPYAPVREAERDTLKRRDIA